MNFFRIAEISRPSPRTAEKTTAALAIDQVKQLSSYSWIDAPEPTIAVPGSPSKWSPPKAPEQINVPKDFGLIYVAENEARLPDSPLEPLFRALHITNPSFDIDSVDIVTDRNNIRKLLSFISPAHWAKNESVGHFTIHIEAIGSTMLFCRAETLTSEFIEPNQFVGFGHEFEKAYTTSQIEGSTGHYRIISYRFSDLNLVVRHETDGYIDNDATPKPVSTRRSARLDETCPVTASADSKLRIQKKGNTVPAESVLEIKTRTFHKRLNIQEFLPQLWASQTPNFVCAYHKRGIFGQAKVEDVTLEIKQWEKEFQEELGRLAELLKEIINVVGQNGGNAVLRYDEEKDKLVVWKVDGRRLLPNDLYSRLNKNNVQEAPDAAIDNHEPYAVSIPRSIHAETKSG